MIQGAKRVQLTYDNILKRIDEYSIYRYYIGRDFQINRNFHSPFPGRKDTNPSFSVFAAKGGFLYHTDFADTRYRGKAPDFVMQMFNLTFDQALRKIDHDFGLGISSAEVKDYKKMISDYKKPVIEKVETLIQAKVRRFDSADLAYWAQYNLSEMDLKQEYVFAIKKLYVNKKLQLIKPTELVFGYLYEDKWKIYRPFSDKENKWRNNVPIDRMDGLENIHECKKAIITKSKKDKMVIRKIFPCVCSVQNESHVAINEANISYLQGNSKEQYVAFDNDETGKRYSRYYTENFGMKHINVPDFYYIRGIKDFADWVKEEGLQAVENYFRQKKLL